MKKNYEIKINEKNDNYDNDNTINDINNINCTSCYVTQLIIFTKEKYFSYT